MKLLYISTLDHIVRVMLPHLDGAKAAGYETHVACQFTRFKDEVAAHADGLHHVPIQRNPLDPRNVIALIQLIRLIRKLQPDIVHCHNPSGGFYGRLAATIARTGATRVYTAHGFHFHPLGGKLSNALYRIIEGFAGRFLSDAVLTINQWDFEEAKKLMPPKRVHFTHGVGVSADEFDLATVTPEDRQAIREEFGIPDNGLLISCIGELIPRKNQEDAILALRELSEEEYVIRSEPHYLQDPSAFPFLVLVGDGKQLKLLKEMVSEPKCIAKWDGVNGEGERTAGVVVRRIPQRHVCFPGFRRDTKQILAATDIFLFPSLQEGLPCAVQEALCMAVPVVCYRIRGCQDMVEETCGRVIPVELELYGQLISVGCYGLLSEALRELIAMTASQRKALGRAGREKMIEHYSRPVCVAEWLAIYSKISPSPNPFSQDWEEGAGGRRAS